MLELTAAKASWVNKNGELLKLSHDLKIYKQGAINDPIKCSLAETAVLVDNKTKENEYLLKLHHYCYKFINTILIMNCNYFPIYQI